eukprot:CAMPEP_0178396694 /NCGR_PEP_ID=MMETSP0689_2-20121128/13859_1 /TAXON_ID=160604 /ORGANISM="Amphidinium massartii, Strain CS-259" /LENGTH=156 /DNA_ID=CAMNT_0020017373 /DNA_START=164 /DNA_END=635 /DNA_ORIENTATION=+
MYDVSLKRSAPPNPPPGLLGELSDDSEEDRDFLPTGEMGGGDWYAPGPGPSESSKVLKREAPPRESRSLPYLGKSLPKGLAIHAPGPFVDCLDRCISSCVGSLPFNSGPRPLTKSPVTLKTQALPVVGDDSPSVAYHQCQTSGFFLAIEHLWMMLG